MTWAAAQSRDGPATPAPRAPGGRASCGPALGNRALARLGGPDAVAALAPQLGNRARGALLQRAVCDRPKKPPKEKGEAREVDTTTFSPTVALIGDKAWELFNFDVDKAYTKEEHEQYIKDVVVPKLKTLIEDHGAYVAVVGEASSTASFSHNLDLSRNRATCVSDILRRELAAAGVTDTSRVLPPKHVGELFSHLRHGDEFEDKEDRRVTILAVEEDPEEICPAGARTRPSDRFKAKVACDSPGSVAINLGDVSDPVRPTWRAFRWIRSPAASDCAFRAASSPDAFAAAGRAFHLALRDPDDPAAPSDLQGDAALNVGFDRLFAAGGKFTVKLEGTYAPADCRTRGGELPGWLLPVGPVFCGEVPQPARGPACDDEAETCTASQRLAPAKRFGAMIERVGFDLPLDRVIKRLPPIARHLLDGVVPEMGIALVHVGTLDGPEPRRMRTFLFTGLRGSSAGLNGQVGFDKEAISAEPVALALGDPDEWFADSDLDSDVIPWQWPPKLPDFAELEIKGNSNVEVLSVGGMSFEFHGALCNAGGDRTVRGWFGGVTPVSCTDLGPLLRYEPERNCEAEECPEDQQLAEHDSFRFKIGRASLSGLPLAGRKLADAYGCEVVAAFVNIGSASDDGPIHREFLFIGRHAGCRFDVAQGGFVKTALIDRVLAVDDADDPLAVSDFHGLAELGAGGRLSIRPATFKPNFDIAFPGAWDSACKGTKQADGVMIPLGDVECGPVPDPPHDMTPDPDTHAACRNPASMHPIVQREIERFALGDYEDILAAIDEDLGYAAIYFTEPLTSLRPPGRVLSPAVFVGRNWEGVPVITFVDMEVTSYSETRSGAPRVGVRFTSEACSYDMDGNPIFVQPVHCREGLPFKGQMTRLKRLPTPGRPDPPDTPPVPVPDDTSSGTGAGSRTAAAAPPDEPVPA